MPDNNNTACGSNKQEDSSLACKNTGVVLMPHSTYNCVPAAISSGAAILKVPGCH